MPVKESLAKFTKNKPLFFGTLGVLGIGAVLYYRHKSAASAASAATGAGTVTDPDGNVCSALNPATGFCPGTPGDQAALAQANGGGFVGDPFGGGSFGTGGGGTGGGTGNISNPITTKEEWIQEAERVLPNGHSADVRNALLGVLGGLTVTQDQRRIFLEAAGTLGDPPGGYPKPIKVSDTGGHPGAKKVKVPDVKGDHFKQAQFKISASGLHARKDKPDIVIVTGEHPEAGTEVDRGSTVILSGHK
jgi:hypothetical protein